jgi:hypothetical protein
MSNITVTGQQAYFNEDAKFFKDVYIYGTLYYEFESASMELLGDVEINGKATFNGPAAFNDNVVFNDNVELNSSTIVKELTVTEKFTSEGNSLFSGISTFNGNIISNEDIFAKRLNVSEYFGVGIGSTVISASSLTGNVGINSLFPEQKLDINGSIKIDEFIYDSVNSSGGNGFYLSMDEEGIRWVAFEPSFTEGIFIQDEGTYIPIAGLAQSFTALNFKQINSFGIGTDTIIPIPSPSNPTFIADIQSKDFWGYTSSGNIYRMTSVGIQNNNPTSTLDITGTLHVTDAVDFDSTLNVDLTSRLRGLVTVDSGIVPDSDEGAYLGTAALPFSDAHIGEIKIADGANDNTIDTATGDLILDAATNLVNVQADLDVDGTLNVDSTSTLVGQVQVNTGIVPDSDEGAYLGTAALPFSDAHIAEIRIANGANDNTIDTATGDLILDAATNLVNVQADLDVDGTLNVDGATTLQTTLQVGVAGTIITTTGIGSVGFGTNNPRRDIQFKEKDVFFDGGAIYDTNENVGFRSEQYQVPRNVLTTVGVDTTGSIIPGRFFDAANLIRLNLDFIANETIGFLTSTDYKNPAFTIVNSSGIATDPVNCKDDIKSILKAITYDITRGGNSRSVGAGLSYYNGPSLIHITGNDINGYSVKDATIVAITTAAQIARYVINNAPLSKSYQSVGSSFPQIKDLTLEDDSVVGFNTSIDGCSNVVSAITVCAGIVTTIIGNGPSASPRTTYPDGKIVWSPPGADSKNIIYVSKYGNDDNNGRTEGAAKLTIGAAADVAQPGDTIMVRSGVYFENNPIGLRTDVTVSGQDLRLVSICPQNDDDVFYVRRGCLIENLSFAYSKNPFDAAAPISIKGAAVAFPPPAGISRARSGYLDPGPATEGPTGRWRSPYIRNCTNFMSGSIGMKINGDHATASTIGNDLKCMVCDSFTQYNEAGIGVSITNNGYAQLVSIFTINCDIAIYADTGGSCDLTNSNSSFGNFGLVAVGLGSTEFTGIVSTYPPTRTQPGVDAGSDKVTFANMKDNAGNVRRPYDGQALFFKIDLDNYPDAQGTGILQEPMVQIKEIKVTNSGSGYSPVTPPTVFVYDDNDQSQQPKGPQGIIAELSPTIDEITGTITAIDVVNSGRNYLPTQNLKVFIDGGSATADVVTQPIYYSVDSATETTPVTGITIVTFTEFIPYELFGGEEVSLKRISRILTSSHSFEYIGTGTDINTSTPFKGGVSIKENEIVALDGAQIPFTSTDQKGNFDIGEGFQINQPSAVIRGRDFSKAIQAEVTPLILALR